MCVRKLTPTANTEIGSAYMLGLMQVSDISCLTQFSQTVCSFQFPSIDLRNSTQFLGSTP